MLSRLTKKRGDEGFTLIELLVVIIIIGILAAIAIPVFLNQRASAAKASLTSDARNSAVAVETYFTENSAYPVDLAALPADVTVSENNGITTYSRAADGNSFTLCVQADDGAALGWSVTYDSAAGGVNDPVEADCA